MQRSTDWHACSTISTSARQTARASHSQLASHLLGLAVASTNTLWIQGSPMSRCWFALASLQSVDFA
eukprot:7616321-Karenia_brevis.AAC.1